MDGYLPNINVGDQQNIVDTSANFNQSDNERLFVVGFASRINSSLNHGLAVATNLINNEVIEQSCIRSIEDNENTRAPQNTTQNVARNNERYSSLPSYPGLSGGPILRCKLGNNAQNKKCVVIGTVWGSERIFHQNGNLRGFRKIHNTN
jgi:hypothetical protein